MEEEDSEILTDPRRLSAVRRRWRRKQIPMAAAEVTMIPQSYVELTDEQDRITSINFCPFWRMMMMYRRYIITGDE